MKEKYGTDGWVRFRILKEEGTYSNWFRNTDNGYYVQEGYTTDGIFMYYTEHITITGEEPHAKVRCFDPLTGKEQYSKTFYDHKFYSMAVVGDNLLFMTGQQEDDVVISFSDFYCNYY